MIVQPKQAIRSTELGSERGPLSYSERPTVGSPARDGLTIVISEKAWLKAAQIAGKPSRR
jgi:hypothetical protein